jgi:Mg/Co/Ni transporter MgtE
MNPKKLAEAISQMELDDAKRVFASCKRGDRANILENLSSEASGSLVGALDPQSAVEALKMIEEK